MWRLIFRLKFWSPLIWKRIKINTYDLQTHKSIIQNVNAASKTKASKTKPLVQLKLLLFAYVHCNIVLLCKVPFHKILLFNASGDPTGAEKLSVIMSTPIFQSWNSMHSKLLKWAFGLCHSVHSAQRHSSPQWGKEDSITLHTYQ